MVFKKRFVTVSVFMMCLVCPNLLFAFGKDIPLKAKADIKNQIASMIGSSIPKGIPLLDSWTDWNDPKNWPKQYTFNDNILYLDVSAPGILRSMGEPAQPLPAEIPKTFPMGLDYYQLHGSQRTSHPRPHCSWRKDGTIRDKGAIFWSKGNSKTIFFLKFYASGELLMHARTDATTGNEITDYFEKNGWLTGTLIQPHDGSGSIYQEKGKEKDLVAYNAMIDRLNRDNQDEDALPNLGVSSTPHSSHPYAEKVRIGNPSDGEELQ
jgi:hypothetical protein